MTAQVSKITRARKVKKETDTLFGRAVRPVVVVDICMGNVTLLSSEHFKSNDLFIDEVSVMFPELVDECKQRFKNDGKLDLEITEKQRRQLI